MKNSSQGARRWTKGSFYDSFEWRREPLLAITARWPRRCAPVNVPARSLLCRLSRTRTCSRRVLAPSNGIEERDRHEPGCPRAPLDGTALLRIDRRAHLAGGLRALQALDELCSRAPRGPVGLSKELPGDETADAQELADNGNPSPDPSLGGSAPTSPLTSLKKAPCSSRRA